MTDPAWGLDTRLQHLAEEELHRGAIVPPIYQTSLFGFDDSAELFDAMENRPEGPPAHYSRLSNPTVDVLEAKLADLEGTERAKVFGSGMAAIAAAVLAACRTGGHIILVDTAYLPTRKLVQEYLPRFGVTHSLVDGRDVDAISAAIRPETCLIYLESPSSLLFRLQDIAAVVNLARERGIATAIDSTYSAGMAQQPARLGVDLVLHSVTKYMNGHSDVVAGAVCASQAWIERMVRNEVALFGGIIAPFPAWLVLRGLRTLPLRFARHAATADTLATWLEAQPWVERVHHVSLPSYPQRDLFLRQMSSGSGLFSFEPRNQDADTARAFCRALRLFRIGVSWGGHESLAIPIEATPLDLPGPRRVIRLSCGLEAPEDLIFDLAQAAAGTYIRCAE